MKRLQNQNAIEERETEMTVTYNIRMEKLYIGDTISEINYFMDNFPYLFFKATWKLMM